MRVRPARNSSPLVTFLFSLEAAWIFHCFISCLDFPFFVVLRFNLVHEVREGSSIEKCNILIKTIKSFSDKEQEIPPSCPFTKPAQRGKCNFFPLPLTLGDKNKTLAAANYWLVDPLIEIIPVQDITFLMTFKKTPNFYYQTIPTVCKINCQTTSVLKHQSGNMPPAGLHSHWHLCRHKICKERRGKVCWFPHLSPN